FVRCAPRLTASPHPMEGAVSVFNFRGKLQQRMHCVIDGWKHRKGLALLAKFDDRALADIGLTRSDLYDALGQRIWDDPTTMLERRRTARRESREQFAGHVGQKCRQSRQMLGVPGLKPPPIDRPARYLV